MNRLVLVAAIASVGISTPTFATTVEDEWPFDRIREILREVLPEEASQRLDEVRETAEDIRDVAAPDEKDHPDVRCRVLEVINLGVDSCVR